MSFCCKSLEAGYARQFICATHEMYLQDVSNENLRVSAHAQNTKRDHGNFALDEKHLRGLAEGTNMHRLGCAPRCGRKLAKRSDKCQDCITFECVPGLRLAPLNCAT